MANKSTNKTTTNTTNKDNTVYVDSPYEQFAKTAFYTVWSVVGLILIILLGVAVFGNESWEENLNITADPGAAEQATPQQPPQPEAPPQPTEEQLACVEDELGTERFEELEQGMPAEEDEMSVLEECLTE